jgi:hypothetical protein
MTDILLMEIASIGFSLRSTCFPIQRNTSPPYQQFIAGSNNASCDTIIEINLELDNLPDTEKMRRIFDSEQAWTMFFDGKNYFLKLKPPTLHEPVWIARFGSGFNKATIYYSESFCSKESGKVSVLNPVSYPLDQLLLMYILSRREGIIIHAAGIHINGRGFIFPGKSGAGKSTLSRLFACRNGVEVLSDDRIVVRKINNTFKAYGTPWPGEEGIAINKTASLVGMFFILHAGYNRIEEIKPQKALENILPVVSIPWYDKETMIKILDFCDDLISNIPAYELHFRPDNEIADVFEKFAYK